MEKKPGPSFAVDHVSNIEAGYAKDVKQPVPIAGLASGLVDSRSFIAALTNGARVRSDFQRQAKRVLQPEWEVDKQIRYDKGNCEFALNVKGIHDAPARASKKKEKKSSS